MALSLALLLLIPVGGVLVMQPDLRVPASIGLVGLVIALQLIVLWGNRGMVTPYTQAQRAFMAGDFAEARDILLELTQQKKRPGVDTYVLLGNTYRHLSDLGKSEDVLSQAVEIRPNYHFALYGLGRTLFAQGDYKEAAVTIAQALEAGSPEIIMFDLAHVYYRLGNPDTALDWLRRMPPPGEPYRDLMTAYLLHKLGSADAPNTRLIEAGLPFWEAEADRFQETRYGQDIAADVQQIRNLL
jgi:tetratricopeptide (TPR) repeat protein